MRASWADAPNASYLYTPELLADCFRYPGAEFGLAPSVYEGSELIAFAAGLPRQVRVAGATRRILIATFVTVAAAHKASGYGTAVWSELMRRSAAAGYDGVVTYCAAGQMMQRIVERCCRVLEFPHVPLKSFSYLVRAMPASADAAPDVGTHPTARALVEAGAKYGRAPGQDTESLHRVWSEPEAEWQLSRLGAVAVTGGGAVLSGTVSAVDDAARTRCLIVGDILWGREGAARHILLAQLLDRAAGEGASYVGVPLLGYTDCGRSWPRVFSPPPTRCTSTSRCGRIRRRTRRRVFTWT